MSTEHTGRYVGATFQHGGRRVEIDVRKAVGIPPEGETLPESPAMRLVVDHLGSPEFIARCKSEGVVVELTENLAGHLFELKISDLNLDEGS